MKRLVFSTVILLLLSSIAMPQEVTTWKGTSRYFIVPSEVPMDPVEVLLEPPIDITINQKMEMVVIDYGYVEYDPKSLLKMINNDIVTSLYSGKDHKGVECVLSINFGKDDDEKIFIIIGVWYSDRSKIFFKAYPTGYTKKLLRKGVEI